MRHTSRRALLALVLVLCAASGSARSHPVIALAPVDVLADGLGDLAGIAVDSGGQVFVTDRRAGTIVRITPDHGLRAVASGLAHPVGIALDGQGRLLVVEERGGRVVRLEADGRRTSLITGVKTPRWIALDDDGTVYVSAHRLKRPALRGREDDDADPELILAWSEAKGLRVFADDFRQLEGIAVFDGAVHALARGRQSDHESDGAMYRIAILPDGDAGAVTRLTAGDRFTRPIGLVRDRLGALYLTATRFGHGREAADHVVVKLARDGVPTLFASVLEEPSGLAFDDAGNLYVTDGGAGRVVRFAVPPAPALDPLVDFTREPTTVAAGTAIPRARIDLATEDFAMSTGATDAGRFSVQVPLVVDGTTSIAVTATPHDGAGLTSPPVHASVVHDGVAPSAAFVTPAAGAFVRGTATVQAQAGDTGSGLAGLALSRGGAGLAAAVTPPLPSATALVTAAWDTGGLPDGTYTLSVTASDRAGNTTIGGRTVLVDNTAPDTSITAGPVGTTSETAVTFTIAGSDNLSPGATLSFSWRLHGGPWSAFSESTTIALTGLAQGPHRFEARARDVAGNEDPTPAVRDFTVGGTRISITAPDDGTTVTGSLVIVRGIVESAASDTGIVINGVVASVTGNAFAAPVRLNAGVNTVTAIATTPGGAGASASISVVAIPDAASGRLNVTPRAGVAPLTATFSLFGLPDGAAVVLDANGDGVSDFSGSRLENETFVFTVPGMYIATAVVTERDGTQTRSQAVVEVVDRSALDAILQAKWSGMKDALRASDIARALTFVVERRQADYDTALRLLAADLPVIDTILTDISLVEVRPASAIYEMTRADDGLLKSFEIRFAVESDGVWRLEAF